jgi:hypothetical protein
MKRPILAANLALVLALGLLPAGLAASDHRSPLKPPELWAEEARLTDLFAFPDGDRLVLILGFFRDVDSIKDWHFDQVEIAIHLDLESPVSYDNESDLAHYGGTLAWPEAIAATASLRFRLNDDGTIKKQTITGLKDPEGIRVWVGLRDDPFIFPTFNGKNVMALVASIPFSSFPAGQKDWVLWGASTYGATAEYQIDLSERALHNVEPRLKMFDQLPPSLHVKWLKTQRKWSYDFPDGIRPYDYAPGVMIFTTRRKAGYPNGRLLTDDVVALVCHGGDCGAYERSIITGGWPRSTHNDKPFLKEFPYLAAPHEVRLGVPGAEQNTGW